MSNPVIIEEFRGESLENTHQGLICILNEEKEVIYERGDIDQYVFYRSAMKPLQAIPAFTTNMVEKYRLTPEEAALFTASQRGEAYHQAALESLLNKLQLKEDALVCNPSYPLNDAPKDNYIWDHKPRRRLLHNCSGKHLGFLGYIKEKGYDVSGYEQLNHPLQQEILEYVADLAEIEKNNIQTAIDGCGVPVHAVPLRNMAVSFLKFVRPDLIANKQTADAVRKVGDVMNAQPEIVASHDFICTALLEDENIIAKGGAQGVYCLALRKEKMSIALKVLSGSELVWPILVAALLKKIHYQNQDTIERLLKIRSMDIMNDNGKLVGQTKVYL
ncbi:asparaginase [Oceanobacillus picturae]|uniref:asparaginase n=1 Tax=Oceanobacillus picturae TaxID=171693 RepID=UPI0036392E99